MMYAVIFLFGISIGSFLNVLIDRLSIGESIGGRSHCDYCKKTLSFFDLIPILSFMFLRGKCRYCKKSLSLQYPSVELLTGMTFVGIALYSLKEFTPLALVNLLLLLIIYSGLIVILIADLKFRIIPDEMLIVITTAVIIQHLLVGVSSFPISFACGLILFAIFLMLFLITKGKGMGFGDVKYAFFMGFFLGFPGAVISFYVAFLTGALLSIILILIGKKRFGQTIAFGPFLILGTVCAHFLANPLWRMFLNILGYP